MPTVVLMDVSLSMTRPVSLEGNEDFQRKNLAVHGLNMLFEHMASNYRLEFTALMAFSSLWELLVPFTRDYNALQVSPASSVYCFVPGWLLLCNSFISRKLWAAWMIMTRLVSNQLFKGWTVLYSKSGGTLVPVRYLRPTGPVCTGSPASFTSPCLRPSCFIVQVVLVTDGSLGIGKGSLRYSLQTLKQRGDDKKFPLPFPFPTKLYIMCVANAEEVTGLLMWTHQTFWEQFLIIRTEEGSQAFQEIPQV